MNIILTGEPHIANLNSAVKQSNNSQHLLRFVDRDMVMRFHPGMAIGHTYHDFESAGHRSSTVYGDQGVEEPSGAPGNADPETFEESELAADSDGSMDSMDGGWADEVGSQYDSQDINGVEEEIDDDEFLALNDMYE